MNKKNIGLTLLAFVLGLSINNFAMSNVPANYKVGVVDVQKVVASSEQVKVLKQQQIDSVNKTKDFISKAQADINAQKDAKKKAELIKKYDNDLSYMKNTNDKKYAKNLAEIDKSISKSINVASKNAGYDLVLAKGVVLYGGTDITAQIMKVVK